MVQPSNHNGGAALDGAPDLHLRVRTMPVRIWRFSEVPSATLLVRFHPDCGHQQTATTSGPFMSSRRSEYRCRVLAGLTWRHHACTTLSDDVSTRAADYGLDFCLLGLWHRELVEGWRTSRKASHSAAVIISC